MDKTPNTLSARKRIKSIVKEVFFFGVMIARWPYDSILAPFAVRDLNEKYNHSKVDGIDKLVDLSFSYNYHGLKITPFQVKSEITQLLKIVEALKPETVLEVGTAKGGTLFMFSRVIPDDAKIISLDMRIMPGEGLFVGWRPKFFKGFVKQTQNLDVLWCDSHEISSFEKVEKILDGRMVDFLFIDGDHTYAGAKKDFIMYSKLVRKGGIIGMHDVARHPPETNCDVYRFFNEIEKEYRAQKIIENPEQGWGGIGIIRI